MVVFGKATGFARRRRALWGAALWAVGCGGVAVHELPDPEVELAGSGGRGGRSAAGGNGGSDPAGAPSLAGEGGQVPEIAGHGGAGMGGAPVSDGGDGGDLGAGGEPWVVEEDPPYSGPTVVELRLGDQHSCARLEDETIQCWGKDVIVHDDNPDGGWTTSGIVTWPSEPSATTGLPEPPSGTFTEISYGSAHACAFSEARGVVCWGNDDGFQASPPATLSASNRGYVRVATGGAGVHCAGRWYETEEEGGGEGYDPSRSAATACGLKVDGRLECFGAGLGAAAPRKKFLDVSASEDTTCGITLQGVECWGDRAEGSSHAGDFVQVSTSAQYTCVVDIEQRLLCWAPLPGGIPMTVPAGRFRRVAAAGTTDYGTNPHISALRADGNIVTWTPEEATGAVTREFEVPGPFEDLTANTDSTCAVEASGGYRCWGSFGAPDVTEPVTGDFERVVAGFGQGCGLHRDGSVSCWGGLGQWDTDDFVFVVGEYPGPFTDLSMGSDYACGILADGGGLQCWGSHVR